MKAGLYGKQTHVSPLKALIGLDPKAARKKVGEGSHSIWDLLHHIVIWQDATIDGIQGREVDWNEVESKNWPSSENAADDSEWDKLVMQFHSGLDELDKIIESCDFAKVIPEWNASVAEALLIVLQHNSYHLGQIVSVRQATGNWTTSSRSAINS